MKVYLLLFLITLCWSLESSAAKPYDNACYSDKIKSLQVYPEDNPLGYPFIGLHSGEKLEFHFDEMSTDLNYYNHGVIHCTHDWQPSDIDANEYIQGFQYENISTFEAAFSTMYNYVHYQFTYPGDMSVPRYSGNYLMVVFSGSDINDQASWLLTYRFIIYESSVSVLSKVSPSSIIADRYRKQEVDFDINHKDFTIYDPMREVNVSVLQNMDWKTSVNNLKPIFIKPDVLTFDYSNGENTFDGGSEWRNFDIKNFRYISPEIELTKLETDGYHVILRQDIPEGKKAYASWTDLNGNWLVKNDDASDSDLESDYAFVHFILKMDEVAEGEVMIEGKFNMYGKPLKCTYSSYLGGYTCIALVKQGYYNYRYIVRDLYMAKDNLQQTEGNYAVTENDYHIIVYMYDRNKGCDRVVAVKADSSFPH